MYKTAKALALLFAVVPVVIYSIFFLRSAFSGEICVVGACFSTRDPMPLYLTFGALFFTAIGTISTMILGWRSEKRQALESRLKVAQLELELAKARGEVKN